ncbi:putative acylesterase/phospholipase RssA [Haloferula luteola]|uniref:Putative acylesterase/phospholipase RssA n=1 Tax=Haloferula luteola TaxID=595692 RepID=A0A840V6Q4_9BACT|nr:patatin-like phospholipase family protein [Haloferula luteola]MBB5353652.1 putative acylesterase/phospholipase RssA [Haloferula luteola]
MPDTPFRPNPHRTAVVLGSSLLGVYAHAGFLNGLIDRGFHPARLSGASAGALAGALYACGLRGDDLRHAALDPKMRWSYFDLGFLWRMPGVGSVLWANGIFHGKGKVRHLRKLLGDAQLDGLKLDIAVTDIESQETVIRHSGPLPELVMASCAVPGLFTIQNVGNHRYLDGGIAAEYPFEHLLDRDDIDTILIHRIQHIENSSPVVNWETVAKSVGCTHHTACKALHAHRLRIAADRGKRVVEVTTTTPFPSIFNNRHAVPCYEAGHATALQSISPS